MLQQVVDLLVNRSQQTTAIEGPKSHKKITQPACGSVGQSQMRSARDIPGSGVQTFPNAEEAIDLFLEKKTWEKKSGLHTGLEREKKWEQKHENG